MDDEIDDLSSFSAANLSRLGEEPDQYQEEGFEDQVLLGDVHPLANITSPLQVNTRHATSMAGEISFPPCQSNTCRGCTPDCRQTYEDKDENLWCIPCTSGRGDLCTSRARCITWSDGRFRQFQDMQLVVGSGALGTSVPGAPLSTPLRRPARVNREEDQTESEPVGNLHTPSSQPLSSSTLPTTSSSATPVLPSSTPLPQPLPSHPSSQSITSTIRTPTTSETPSYALSFIESVRPRVKTSSIKEVPDVSGQTSSKQPLQEPERPPAVLWHRKQVGVPVGNGKIQAFPHLPEEPLRYKAYGTQALSPFPQVTDNTEQMLASPGLFASPSERVTEQKQESKLPWDGSGLPEARARSGEQSALWMQMRNMEMEESQEDFLSPMSQTPASAWSKPQEAQQTEWTGRSILKPATFIPPTRQEQREALIYQEAEEYHMPSSCQLRSNSASRMSNTFDPPAGSRGQEDSTSVTWSSTPQRRPRPREEGRRRVRINQPEEDEEALLQTSSYLQSEQEASREDNQVKVARVLEMLTQQLVENRSNKPAPSASVKLPQMNLPTPSKKSVTGEVTTKAFFLWKSNLAHSIRNHQLNQNTILLLYSTNKLLPAEWQTILSSSSTLQEAIYGLDMLYPPLASIQPEIVKAMTSLSMLSSPSEKTKIFRISSLLKSLEELIKLFGNDPSKDLSRQETMVIIYNLSSSQESRAELVTEICGMDRARRRGVLYAQSLKDYLVKTRMVLSDIVAAVRIVQPPAGDGKFHSAAAKMRMKQSEQKKEIKCMLCPSKLHPTFACTEQLNLLRGGHRTLPSKVCKICLQYCDDKHPKDCALKRIQKEGVYQIIDFRCSKGCGINNRLCACKAGPIITIDKDQTPAPKKVGSAATKVVEINLLGGSAQAERADEEEQGDEGHPNLMVTAAARPRQLEDQNEEVIFQAENVFLQGKDKQTLKVVASFDSHGSSHFLSGEIPDNFNFGSSDAERSFEIDTIHGKTFTRHQVFRLKILTLKGAVSLTAIKGSWIAPNEESLLESDVAERFGVTVPELEDQDGQALPRIIIGASLINLLHPRYATNPAGLSEVQPGLACFRSRISRSLICAGTKRPSSERVQ